MATLSDCKKCKDFLGVSYVHETSILHQEGVQPGWYVTCGVNFVEGERVSVSGVRMQIKSLVSYQNLTNFLKLNKMAKV